MLQRTTDSRWHMKDNRCGLFPGTRVKILPPSSLGSFSIFAGRTKREHHLPYIVDL